MAPIYIWCYFHIQIVCVCVCVCLCTSLCKNFEKSEGIKLQMSEQVDNTLPIEPFVTLNLSDYFFVFFVSTEGTLLNIYVLFAKMYV